ncbi:MAG: helix-hairpin-helix domain-containing protein [Paraclostridium sp.]|uniref:helix-hairpin-helix domain-containing protein n=1 Tax=Paraclostridium sp. TaxID=2023273 RepID=UPI003F2D02BF
MDKIKVFLPIIIIIIISSIFVMKNTLFTSNKDMYVVSEIENEKEFKDNNEKDMEIVKEDENYNEEKISNDTDINSNVKANESINKKITIFISGAVKSPGVVELNSTNRLMDGVNLCGGVTEEADMNRINLAMKIVDEGHYIIPKIGEEVINSSNEVKDPNTNETTDKNINVSNNENSNSDVDKININSASIVELDSLPGVGEVTAQKIIDYREENMNFKSIEEIKNVKGIGENKFNDLKDYISI